MGDSARCRVNVRHIFNPFQINYFNFDNQIIYTSSAQYKFMKLTMIQSQADTVK